MLESDPVESAVLGGARGVKQRCVAFPQRDGLIEKTVERKQFGIPPDAALTERFIRCAARAPSLDARLGFNGALEMNFEQGAASRAIIDCGRNGKSRATALLEAG